MRVIKLLIISFILSFIVGCGGYDGEKTGSDTVPPDTTPETLADVFPYVENGKYQDSLKKCATVSDSSSSCSLTELPFIGQESTNPSNAILQERMLVSHKWMGDRFLELMDKLPSNLRPLFSSVTAIVIGSKVRPSYYWTVTGAIYIDPEELWLTNVEKQTIDKAPDYRSDFGKDLSFVFLQRYIKNNDYAYKYYDLDGDEERTIDDIIYPLASLLYHELAHANDFMPQNQLLSVNVNETVYQNIIDIKPNWLSNELYQVYPLSSVELTELAGVRYKGNTATTEQKLMRADYVGLLFNNDGANEFYSYTTKREDLADLIEVVSMKYNYDLYHDVAFTNKPTSENPTCDEYLVQWGQRNKIATELVNVRAKYVMNKIMPSIDWDNFFLSIKDTYALMENGVSWCNNLIEPNKHGYDYIFTNQKRFLNPNDLINRYK